MLNYIYNISMLISSNWKKLFKTCLMFEVHILDY